MTTLNRAAFRERREALGFTLGDVAEKTGLHLSTIHKLETGKGGAEWDTVTKTMQVLGLDFSDILTPTTPTPADAPAEAVAG